MLSQKKLRWLWPLAKVAGVSVLSLVVLLGVAHLALTYYAEADSVRQAFYRARYWWLAWRVLLYSAVGYGLWRLYRHPETPTAARQRLKRTALAGGLFVLVSELTLWTGGTGL